MKNEFIIKMLDIGACADQACSETERMNLIKEAERLYDEHFMEMNTETKKDIVIKTVSYLYENNMLKNIYTRTWSELYNLICKSIIVKEPEEIKNYKFAILDTTKQYKFIFKDVDTKDIIIIDENKEKIAFKKAFRYFEYPKDRELELISKMKL